MASKTIENMHFYVPITTYTYENRVFHTLRVSVSYCKGRGFQASFTPGWGDNYGWGCVIDGSDNPLTAGMTVDVVPAEKNNAKRIAEMTESLKMAKDIIAALFDDREWQKLKGVLQNAARFGYTEGFKEQAEKYLAERVSKRYEKAVKPIEPVVKQVDVMGLMGALQTKGKAKLSDFAKPIESESNEKENNSNQEIMAQNVKAADLIGKVIIIGGTSAKYIVKSIEGDKLQCDFVNDGKTTPMSVPVSQVEKFIAGGKWTVADATPTSSISPQPSAIKTDADVAEVQDIVPVVTPKKSDVGSMTDDVEPQPSAISPQPSAISPQPSDIKPQPSAIKHQTSNQPKYHVVLLPTKDGQKWPKLYGFKDESEAKKTAGKMAKTVTYSWDRDEQGEKRYYLKGGKKYCEVFQQLADALNAGNRAAIEKACMASVAIFEGARSEGKKKSEGRGKTEDAHQPSNISPQTSTEKTYTQTELAEWLRKLNAGDPKAAKFFNDLAKAA